MPPCTPRNIQESKLGDAPVHPLFHQRSSVRPSPYYIFITSCVMCYSWSVLHLIFRLFCCSQQVGPQPSLICREIRSTPPQNTTQVFMLIFDVCSLSFHRCCHGQLLVFMLIILRTFIQVVAFGTLLSYHVYLVQRVGLLH